MKKPLLLLLLLLLCVFHLRAGDYPIGSLSGTYTVGSSQPTYKKLTDVASILNNTGFTVVGNVVFELDSDYDGTGETFPIVFNQFNTSGNWTVTIRPKAGVTMRTTSGNPGTQPLITLNGTDKLILDGRAGGTGSIAWLIRNTATTDAGATILLTNDAQGNMLTYLQLEGQTASAGVVHIGTSGTEGNDSNTISYCAIRDRTDVTTPPSRPATGILSQGSAASTGNVFDHNNIFNFYNSGGSAYGIRLSQGGTGASITYNNIYQEQALLNAVSGTRLYGIYAGESTINQLTVTGNFIGGSAPQCGGSPLTIASVANGYCAVTGILLSEYNGKGLGNNCNNNTIRNIAITVEKIPMSSTTPFTGISSSGISMKLVNNTIGNVEGHDDITITVNDGWYMQIEVIFFAPKEGSCSIIGNKIGGITVEGRMKSTYPSSFTAIKIDYLPYSPAIIPDFLVNDNIIGSTTMPDNIRFIADSLPISFSGIASGVSEKIIANECKNNTIAGVFLGYAGTTVSDIRCLSWDGSPAVIDGNLISDISTASLAVKSPFDMFGTGLLHFSGISTYAPPGGVISNNTIRRLRRTGSTPVTATQGQVSSVYGISVEYAAARICNNKIYDLTSANNLGPVNATVLSGINIFAHYSTNETTIYNNLIALDNGSNTNNCEIRAIQVRPSNNPRVIKIYHNTVYVGGNNGNPANTAISYLVSRSRIIEYTGVPELLLRNNLLVNGRTGGSGPHYVFHNTIPALATGWTVATSDSNVVVMADAGRIALWGTSDLDSTQWKITGGDAHSSFYTSAQVAPAALFTNAAAGDLSIKPGARRYVIGKGTVSTGVTTDYTGETRSTTAPTIGAYEYLTLPNEAPVITSHGGSAAVTLPIPENTILVTTVTATDAGTLTYSLTGGEDAAKFTIDPSTGVLSFITAPDFEQPGDANGDNAYIVTVQVSDGDSTVVQRFKIKVTDANDHAPVITSYSGSAAVTIQVPENTTTVIATVTATDADKNPTITYSLVNEEDAAQFGVNPSTGELSFVTPPPDFEYPRDGNGDNVYVVTVKASDGDSSATQRFKVKLMNVNDNAPVIISYNGDALVSLQLPEDSLYVTTVTATDADNTPVTYSVLGEKDGARFTVDPSTGRLSFITAPDFEHPADANGDNIYLVSVQASDGSLTAVQRFSVKITDTNDNPPVVTMTIRIPEGTVEVTPLEGSDDDAGSTVVFTVLDKEDGALFWINPANGTLEFKVAPDFDQPADADHDNIYFVAVKMMAGDNITILRFQVKADDSDTGSGRMTGRNTNEPAVQSAVVLKIEAAPETGKAIKVYPNPVTGKQFNLRMDNIATGKYTLELYTTAGQLACKQQLNHAGKPALYPVQLPAGLARGQYILQLTGTGFRYTEKLIVE